MCFLQLWTYSAIFPYKRLPVSISSLSAVHITISHKFYWFDFTFLLLQKRSRGSSVSIVSGYGLDDWAIKVRSPAGARIFPLSSVSRPALGPTQPPVQWVPGVFSLGVKRGRGVMLTTHPHLVPRSRMSRIYTSSLPKRLHGV
jgi:hypothetical protein